jgi:hypothetical protein
LWASSHFSLINTQVNHFPAQALNEEQDKKSAINGVILPIWIGGKGTLACQ